jgi:hypothetical protein
MVWTVNESAHMMEVRLIFLLDVIRLVDFGARLISPQIGGTLGCERDPDRQDANLARTSQRA